MSEKKAKPHAGKVGNLRYKVWENADKNGTARYSVEFFRSYQSKAEGESEPTWKDSHSIAENDLKLIPVALAEIDSYLTGRRSSAA